MDIYFDDFKEHIQKQILDKFKIDSSVQMNWDTIPITTIIEPGDEDEFDEDFDKDFNELIQEDKKRIDNIFLEIEKARQLCIDDLKKKGIDVDTWVGSKIEPATKVGTIVCPTCKGELCYLISRSNGHIHGQCKTEDCLSWME